MALPVSGYNRARSELLFAQCEGFTVSLKGPRVHPKVGRLELHADVTSEVSIEGSAYRSLITPDVASEANCVNLSAPLFFEETDYELIVEKIDEGESIHFYHKNHILRNSYSAVGRSGKVSSALLNFGSQVGYSELSFTRNGEKVLSIIIEIFPTKIDYQKDWKALLERISTSLFSLAYGFLSSTFQRGRAVQEPTKTLGQWYALLEPRFETLLQSVDYIARNPNRKVIKEHKVRPLAQVRRPDRSVRRWLQRNPHVLHKVVADTPGIIQTISGPRLPGRLPESRARLSYDTRENRFLKKLLEKVVLKLGKLESIYVKSCSGVTGRKLDQEFLTKLRYQQGQLRKRLQYDFMGEVGSNLFEGELSTVLQFSPGYRNVFEVGLVLQLGLALSEGIERIELKNVHELYEIWCFLELDKILSELTIAKSSARSPFENKELFWALIRNRAGGARYRSALGDEILLQYNSSQSTPTGSHRPDNLLSIEKIGSENPFRFVLDAKYRIYVDDYSVGPMVDDINAMHRYRDALVADKDTAKRSVTEAIVLFPVGDEETYKTHKYFKSIDRVGVGALPFLPGSKSLVMNLLQRWITEPSTEIDEHSVGVEKHSREGLVLLGPISPRLTLEDVEELGFYHVPKKQLSLENRPITHVALYEPKDHKHNGIVRKLYPINGWEVVPRNSLDVSGRNSSAEELYYRIDLNVEKTENLSIRKMRTAPWGIRNHRYIPLSVFDSTDVLEVMAADQEVAKLRLRIYRFLEFVRSDSVHNITIWKLEVIGKNISILKVINNELVLAVNEQVLVFGAIDSTISIVKIADSIQEFN